jgi:YesN/AraC family two-component response regulator
VDQFDKIFERFYQVSEDGNISVGSGIGLALCKELAEFLEGSLTVESTVGEGSKFTLSLPVAIVEIASEPKTELAPLLMATLPSNGTNEEKQEERREEKPILLIVEDHADLRKFIMSCLGDDYQFLEASNGREGLQMAIEEVPTLILSDVMMPEMDGIEMCQRIKNDQRTCHIPLILLTAKASNESKLSGLDLGADDYIIKPFNKHELKLKIRNQVVARTRMQEKIRLEFLSQSTTIKAVSADEKFLERLKKIVEARLSDEMLSVEALTEEIGMSRAQLYRKVTALTGISGNEFIRKLRLQRAAQLLQQQAGPVSQVAYEVGFSNLSYFSKCFKEQFGVLPSEFVAAKARELL